jgi:DNA-binding transcriptional regulator YiaG
MPVVFRNVDARWEDPVVTWPYEALVTTLERGLVSDWQPVLREMKTNPWGKTARRVEKYLSYQEREGLNVFFAAALQRARGNAETTEREQVALRVREAISRSGLTAAEFAKNIGTSASRLSTYASGQVVPSASMLVRIEAYGDNVSTR